MPNNDDPPIYHGIMPPQAKSIHPDEMKKLKPGDWKLVRPQQRIAPGHYMRSGKTYNHSVGLSCCFRQWRAEHTHCQFLHGYAIKVDLEFQASLLDDYNWVQNFGGLKEVKQWLEDTFDHKTLVARDDPKISIFRELQVAKLIQLVEVDTVGMEAFARMIFEEVETRVNQTRYDGMVDYGMWLHKVTVSEHDGNRAEYGRRAL